MILIILRLVFPLVDNQGQGLYGWILTHWSYPQKIQGPLGDNKNVKCTSIYLSNLYKFSFLHQEQESSTEFFNAKTLQVKRWAIYFIFPRSNIWALIY